MSSLKIEEFKNLKTIGIARFSEYSKQMMSYNCFLCGLASKIRTFSKFSKVRKCG